MSRNGNSSDIPGAPSWVRHLLGRFDEHLEELKQAVGDLHLASGEFRTLRPRVAELEEWRDKIEREVVELKTLVRKSLTPPGGIPAVTPPEDAA